MYLTTTLGLKDGLEIYNNGQQNNNNNKKKNRLLTVLRREGPTP